MEFLVKTTKALLGSINSKSLLENNQISSKTKYELDVLGEQHKLKQNELLIEYSKKETKYVKIIKRWLSNEKTYMSELKNILKILVLNHQKI